MFWETVGTMVIFLFIVGYETLLAYLIVEGVRGIEKSTGYGAVVYFLGSLFALAIILFVAYLFAGIMIGGC